MPALVVSLVWTRTQLKTTAGRLDHVLDTESYSSRTSKYSTGVYYSY